MHQERLNQAEAAVLRESPVLPSRPPDPVVLWLTKAARGSRLWLVLAGALAVHKGATRQAAVLALQSIAISTVVNHLVVKRLTHRRRPRAGNVPAHQALGKPPTSAAFPSAHATSAGAFTTALTLCEPRLGLAAMPVAAAVIYGRVRTRAHWPTDVLGGLVLGSATAAILNRVKRK
ncbi:phosphatase PAP2 family protein [Actinocrispum sp. NPDC049592]|uniref:phosphatase PAP2 family protein n=1 Tax=Actinocrispum sp. NPDC049592 TaxID=3154835 RepID=UPI00344123A9